MNEMSFWRYIINQIPTCSKVLVMMMMIMMMMSQPIRFLKRFDPLFYLHSDLVLIHVGVRRHGEE